MEQYNFFTAHKTFYSCNKYWAASAFGNSALSLGKVTSKVTRLGDFFFN